MPLVKIILYSETFNENDVITSIRDSISDWEEISDEDYKLLKNNLSYIGGFHAAIILKDYVPVTQRIENIKKDIKSFQEQLEKIKLKTKEKKEKQEQNKIAREKALYEKLKEKYEEVDLHEL